MRFCEGESISMLSLSPKVGRNDEGGGFLRWVEPEAVRCEEGDAML